ncbi:MAG: DUF2384 domain-containing protein [Alphaproteobacteria bacterium]|nr:DUF2384 domain-containing protein [Alphaproteobacteria bacterium]
MPIKRLKKAVPAPAPGRPPLDESQVLAKATVRAADFLEIPSATLARILGLSEASISRLRRGQYVLTRGSKEFELAVLFVRLFRGLDALMGSDDVASRSWLAADNLALHAKPIDLIQTVTGLVDTIAYVDSRRALL